MISITYSWLLLIVGLLPFHIHWEEHHSSQHAFILIARAPYWTLKVYRSKDKLQWKIQITLVDLLRNLSWGNKPKKDDDEEKNHPYF